MHVAGGWWDSIRLKLDERELGFTRKETLACLHTSLDFNADHSIASDVTIVATSEVVDPFIFDHTKCDRPVYILFHSIDVKIYSRTIISRGIECRNAGT